MNESTPALIEEADAALERMIIPLNMVKRMRDELARLSASPPPEEIADLIERLEQRPCTPLSELRTEAAAALQRLAQEVERRKERETTWEWAVRGKDKQIGELFDAAKEQGDEIDRLRTRIAELKDEGHRLSNLCIEIRAERDGIREECAKIADRESEAVDGGEYWIAARIAKRIRALSQEAGET